MLTPRWTPLRPHPTQAAYWSSPYRFNVVPAGRRSGKSELGKRKVVKRALRGTAFPNPRFFMCAPTWNQAEKIFWDDLKRMVPRDLWGGKPSESDLILPLINGAAVYVIGLDKPERIEGQPWDGGIIDEYGNVKAGAWPNNVRPALSDRRGWCDLLGVPEGRNHYYDTANAAKARMVADGPASEWGFFTWFSADILPPEEIAAARRDLDDLTFRQEYEASFVSFEGRAYYAFDAETHAIAALPYDKAAPLILCFDFNASPGVAAICQEMVLPNGLRGTGVIGEVYIDRNSNTEMVCRRLLNDWRHHDGLVHVYGDATGGSAGSAKLSGSDWDIVMRELRVSYGGRVRACYGKSNPPERARVNAVNCRLKAGDGDIRLMVDPAKAPHVVKDLEGVRTVKGGSGEIDKKATPALTHISDALGYYIADKFPVAGRVSPRIIQL